MNEQGEVDYRAAQKDPSLLHRYLEQLVGVDFRDFSDNWPREEKLALWLNAYHAGVIRVILDHYPIKSIHDIPGVWDLPVLKIGDNSFSLNDIRTRELMEFFRDEKIHVALACGAKSCPRFRREAYTGPRVEGQLFLATREFVNNPQFNRIVPGEKKIWISRLFKWYAQDFMLDFGSPATEFDFTPEETAILAFITHYLEDPQKVEYLEEGGYKIQYLSFEWGLNERRGSSL